VGRTGTYIVIDAMLAQMKTEQRMGIFDFLKNIRRQRNLLVQTEEQYVFIHDALLAACEGGETDVAVNQLTATVKAMAGSDELYNQWKVRMVWFKRMFLFSPQLVCNAMNASTTSDKDTLQQLAQRKAVGRLAGLRGLKRAIVPLR
jgi:hypothetical protein